MIFVALSWVGLIILVWRMTPRRARPLALPKGPNPLVSIIVPARNEEKALPRLLDSLKSLDYPRYEVIVVDDGSTDTTAAVASAFGARVVSGRSLESGWKGKQWACWQGVQQAHGDVFLFTDADTTHDRDSLSRSVQFLRASGADMLTALPFHDCLEPWEKLLGPFHVLLLALTAPYARPREKRLFAVGQYILVTKTAYSAIGGHAGVRDELVEDLPIANACIAAGRSFRVFPGERLFRVRMYTSPRAFAAGWRRNFRAGLGMSTWLAPFEMAAFAAALTGGGQLFSTLWAAFPPLAAIFFLAWRQRRLGDFHGLGALLAVVNLGVFCYVTALSVYDMAFGKEMVWKGRAYAPAAGPSRT